MMEDTTEAPTEALRQAGDGSAGKRVELTEPEDDGYDDDQDQGGVTKEDQHVPCS